MLINLSNHPSKLWPDKQYQMARASFGRLTDVTFPVIDPQASTNEIQQLANETALYIASLFGELKKDDEQNAVHVMGELTFCYHFVNIMRNMGIRCVASTTERNVNQNDTYKVSRFVFVKFRDYFT